MVAQFAPSVDRKGGGKLSSARLTRKQESTMDKDTLHAYNTNAVGFAADWLATGR